MRPPSFWFAALPRRDPRPPLTDDREADVCIVGAGFTGLWTAYELCRSDPGLRVVVLDAHHAGFGASGRNGGWVVGELAGSPQRWVARAGSAAARAQARAIRDSVDEIGEVVRREQIDCDYLRGGVLRVARGRAQLARLREDLEHERLLLGDEDSLLLDPAGVRARIDVAGATGGVLGPHCARVQPALLVRGLADAAVRAGAQLYERTPVAAIEPGAAVTAAGARVRAPVVVRATEGYTATLRGLRRALLPMNSSMIVTEPLGEQLWGKIGWHGAETLADAAHVFAYLQRTTDGRIALGGRGVPYRFGSRTDREGRLPVQTVRELRARLVALFPPLRDVAVAAGWHGILGVARDWRPAVGLDRASGLAWAGGYVGEGVAAANLAGRTLRDLILGRDSELVRLPWVGPPGRPWEPEPLRFIGARGAYAVYRVADRLEARTGRAAGLARLADRLIGR